MAGWPGAPRMPVRQRRPARQWCGPGGEPGQAASAGRLPPRRCRWRGWLSTCRWLIWTGRSTTRYPSPWPTQRSRAAGSGSGSRAGWPMGSCWSGPRRASTPAGSLTWSGSCRLSRCSRQRLPGWRARWQTGTRGRWPTCSGWRCRRGTPELSPLQPRPARVRLTQRSRIRAPGRVTGPGRPSCRYRRRPRPAGDLERDARAALG